MLMPVTDFSNKGSCGPVVTESGEVDASAGWAGLALAAELKGVPALAGELAA